MLAFLIVAMSCIHVFINIVDLQDYLSYFSFAYCITTWTCTLKDGACRFMCQTRRYIEGVLVRSDNEEEIDNLKSLGFSVDGRCSWACIIKNQPK